ncbi:Rhodanese-like domain-containing protein 11, chloroplastic isoform C [Glycine soja]|uniref:Rhodanese-like domain-containing protein 11, chloroplastic isoform B n=1 Tax=Glycine soja TaxID=3848 RepID=A0A445L2E3_GLYSO|nr:Rhodanese-like domain-containing protein 11, chloroplastic isoform B [Glycine soja]RZC17251.1 Rhodanese-like domain-containing protein 11, chloroplastic isoform C [Glycine soja]
MCCVFPDCQEFMINYSVNVCWQCWTDQQRAAAAKEGWGYRLVFSARLIGVFLVADALYIGAQQIGRYLQDIWTH